MIRASIPAEYRERPTVEPPAWFMAAVLALSIIGMTHDMQYATALGDTMTEEGGSIESQTEFQHGASAAKVQRKIGLVALLCVGLYCVLTPPRGARFELNAVTILVAACLLWAAASLAWSVDKYQTLRELARLFVYAFIAAALARRFDPRTLCLVLAAAFAGSVLAAVGVEVLTGGFRPWVSGYRLTGSMHSNGVGGQSMLVALAAYFFARNAKHRVFWWTVFLAFLTIIVLSKSRTSLITVIVGIGFIHAATDPLRKTLLAATSLASLLALGVLVASAAGVLDDTNLAKIAALGREDGLKSLSDRVPLWQVVWYEVAGRRLEGVGYGAFFTAERVDSLHSELNWYAHHAHSAYVQTIVDVGLIGLALVLATAFAALERLMRALAAHPASEYCILAAWIVAAMVNGTAEAAFVIPRDLGLCVGAAVFSCGGLQVVSSARTEQSRAHWWRRRLQISATQLPTPGAGGTAHD